MSYYKRKEDEGNVAPHGLISLGLGVSCRLAKDRKGREEYDELHVVVPPGMAASPDTPYGAQEERKYRLRLTRSVGETTLTNDDSRCFNPDSRCVNPDSRCFDAPVVIGLEVYHRGGEAEL